MARIEDRIEFGGRQKVFLKLEGLHVLVNILEMRDVFGRKEYQVAPASGFGEKWVQLSSLVQEQDLTDRSR